MPSVYSINDELVWEISAQESYRAHVKALADSINDTARMARTMLSLLLVVALYMGFTLRSSSDENLFLNAPVPVLQVGFSIDIAQSYIFAPPIFLYLHFQVLFLLSILDQKIRKFNAILDQEYCRSSGSISQREVLSNSDFR